MKHVKHAIEDICAQWEREAAQRKVRTPGDPAAQAIESCATEVRAALERVERETATLTVEQYAREHDVDPSTVRRLCEQRLLEGAVKGADNKWHIPRDARRLAKPAA